MIVNAVFFCYCLIMKNEENFLTEKLNIKTIDSYDNEAFVPEYINYCFVIVSRETKSDTENVQLL